MFAWFLLFLGSFFLSLATGSASWGLAVFCILGGMSFVSTDISISIDRLAEAVRSLESRK